MNEFLSKYKDLMGASVLLVLPLLLLFYSGRDPESVRSLSRVLSFVVLPIELGSDAVFGAVDSVWTGYVDLLGVRDENETLQGQVDELTGQILRLKHVEIENRRLRGLCEFKRDDEISRYASAHVVAWNASSSQRMMKIVLDRGEEDGIAVGMPVVTHRGLVGRIERISGSIAEVMLIVDPRSRLNVKVAEKGVTGTLVGSGKRDHFTAKLLHVQKGSNVERLDTIVTSGFDGRFPADIEVGYVATHTAGQTGLFYEVQIAPAVDFSRLQEVLIQLGPAGDDPKQGPTMKVLNRPGFRDPR